LVNYRWRQGKPPVPISVSKWHQPLRLLAEPARFVGLARETIAANPEEDYLYMVKILECGSIRVAFVPSASGLREIENGHWLISIPLNCRYSFSRDAGVNPFRVRLRK
jgi:hypothetical protein